ncbi:hypothetical protein ACWDG9_16920 [Streptomyces sp. NPDC001073]
MSWVYGITEDGRPADYRGHPMDPVGQGAYPYDCNAKGKHPDAMVFKCPTCNVWAAEPLQVLPPNVAWI